MHEFFECLSRTAAVAGTRLALASAAGTVSYRELLERVRAHAQWATQLPDRVGLLFTKNPDQVFCDLALSFAGKVLIPLPEFFSDNQLSHIIQTTHLTDAVADPPSIERAKRLGLKVHQLNAASIPSVTPAVDSQRIIFTSGTSGKPKGVCLDGRQMLASVHALVEASHASAADRYLSVLPNSLLLEQIAGTYLPLSVGAAILFPRSASTVAAAGPSAFSAPQIKPTVTVLVPELLRSWVNEFPAREHFLSSFRFIAVGGAPISQRLAAAAWEKGLPVYEGYGLSECSSVVSVNRPDARRPGTVGRPLTDVQVTVDGGEIVVAGPTVMRGYVNEPPIPGCWRTGDLGYFDPDGFLVVTGRKDSVIVTAAGRNINPEWIEEVMTTDSGIRHCVVVEHKRELVALIVPHDSSIYKDVSAIRDLITFAARGLPDYAKPRRYLPMSDQEFWGLELLTPNFRPRRSEARRVVFEHGHTLQVLPA